MAYRYHVWPTRLAFSIAHNQDENRHVEADAVRICKGKKIASALPIFVCVGHMLRQTPVSRCRLRGDVHTCAFWRGGEGDSCTASSWRRPSNIDRARDMRCGQLLSAAIEPLLSSARTSSKGEMPSSATSARSNAATIRLTHSARASRGRQCHTSNALPNSCSNAFAAHARGHESRDAACGAGEGGALARSEGAV